MTLVCYCITYMALVHQYIIARLLAIGKLITDKWAGLTYQNRFEANQFVRSAPFSLEGEGLGMRVVGVARPRVNMECFWRFTTKKLTA